MVMAAAPKKTQCHRARAGRFRNMKAHFRQRLLYIGLILLVLTSAMGFALYALRQNINLFFTPTELLDKPQIYGHRIQMGGYVATNSVKYLKNHNITFDVTDRHKTIPVTYQGVLPNLFRAGQGVVVTGTYQKQQGFKALEVLAKHDAKYMPSWVAKKLKEKKHDT